MAIVRDAGALETWVASAARTTSGNSGALPGSYDDAESLRVQLNVTAASGTTPSMIVTIEDSLDGTNWNTLDTFPAKTAANREVRNITTLFGDQLRVSWAITGTTPSFTFDVKTFVQ